MGLESGNLSTVLDDLEAAAQQAPHSPYIYFSLASAYHRSAGIHQSMQLIGTAQAKFEEANKKFPEYADGLILYSMVCSKMGGSTYFISCSNYVNLFLKTLLISKNLFISNH